MSVPRVFLAILLLSLPIYAQGTRGTAPTPTAGARGPEPAPTTADLIKTNSELKKQITALTEKIDTLEKYVDYVAKSAFDASGKIDRYLSAGLRIVQEMRADDLPMLFIAIEHDGTGPALIKEITNRGTGKSRDSDLSLSI